MPNSIRLSAAAVALLAVGFGALPALSGADQEEPASTELAAVPAEAPPPAQSEA